MSSLPVLLPVLFFDRPVPEGFESLYAGRATAVGPDVTDLATADAAIVGVGVRWDAQTVRGAAKLKVVSRTGIGYDNVDVASLATVGVLACNAPDAPSVSTAEHTLALLFALTKEVAVNVERARAGVTGPATSTPLELDGCTIGLVALGRIGKRVARAAHALGMRVIAHDPFIDQSEAGPEVTLVSMDTIWKESHVVSLHAPAVASTRHLINATTLAAMRPGSYLINCARGSLVDQDALLAALQSGHLAGAALDVTEPEPLPADHPLLHHPHAIVTPHCASSTAAGRRRLYEHAINNALAVLAGDTSGALRS
jgi:D-3-phosphoglycerate dehydrogenase / 2-oxoglutarate reductase